ncbi:MAG: RHS repeat domain-containing protein [Caldilineaceae bacterium]
MKTETDPLGLVTSYVYDYEEGQGEAGRLIRIEYPQVENENGLLVTPKVTYSYNAFGLLESETDLQGRITRYVYTQGTADEASGGANARFAPGVIPVPGLLTQMIEDFGDAAHLNLITSYKDFDAQGNPQTVVDPRGNVTRYSYDALGRLLTITEPLGEVTKYEYDSNGNLVRQITGYTAKWRNRAQPVDAIHL